MTDDKRGLPHDLPDYTPNWPLPIKVKATVYRLKDGSWAWGHNCPRRLGFALGFAQSTHEAAFAAALKHARGCW